ncbi:hypothetical protein B0T19DRAFT_201827 [Cercophora scortea]|uniref:Uncharacterized protein n=1 Tax=Cercophora scortea TaxID=314031 RepID=A0AAE0M9D3_9PEZI|nr:hypothetical protein B0T19DRAFT_201827 [Cercophora scortea]
MPDTILEHLGFQTLLDDTVSQQLGCPVSDHSLSVPDGGFGGGAAFPGTLSESAGNTVSLSSEPDLSVNHGSSRDTTTVTSPDSTSDSSSRPVFCQICRDELPGLAALSQHMDAQHPHGVCRRVCATCSDGQDKTCEHCESGNATFLCACGFSSGIKTKLEAHIRTANRRHVRCRCGSAFREDRFKSTHSSGSKCDGNMPFICFRPTQSTSHPYVCADRQAFLEHFDNQCERKSRGRPRKRKTPTHEDGQEVVHGKTKRQFARQ